MQTEAAGVKVQEKLRYLEDRWDDSLAATLDGAEQLRYRSNLLGSDLRITNFGGGNTSSKVTEKDPLDGSEIMVLWVKGSGGDLGSMKKSGFAALYLDKLHALERRYRGPQFEDEMVELYSLCNFDNNTVASSIDTPLHGFLPFAHVDHLHPDWGIALAASANGKEKMDEFNRHFGHHLVWLPWQRPGFELGLMLRRAVAENRGCDGIVLGGHGLFTWGEHAARLLPQHPHHHRSTGSIRAGARREKIRHHVRRRAASNATRLPRARPRYFSLYPRPRLVAPSAVDSFTSLPEVRRLLNPKKAAPPSASLSRSNSCPDHFVRTKIRPIFTRSLEPRLPIFPACARPSNPRLEHTVRTTSGTTTPSPFPIRLPCAT